MKIKDSIVNKIKEKKDKMVIEIHEMGLGHSATITTWKSEPERLAEFLYWNDRRDTRIVEHDKHFNKVSVWMKSPRLAQYATK